MSIQKVKLILEKRLGDYWGTKTPIAWDNVNYRSVAGADFITAQIYGVMAVPIAITCQRDSYQFIIQVFTEANLGTNRNYGYVDELIALFTNFSEENLRCGVAHSERIGSENEWYHTNVFVDVFYDNHL